MQITAFRLKTLGAFLLISSFSASFANAGVFNMPHFVEPGKNAVGFEPEITLTNGGGVAGNIRYTQGVTDLNNLNLILGTGTGERKFRVGGNFTFDFFPDVGDQPGMGVAAQGVYYRYDGDYGQLETAAVPYVHKTFHNRNGDTVEPYLALPFGPAFHSGEYHWQSQIAMGAIFQPKTSVLRFVGEFGVNLSKTESYVSGGILYQPE